MKSPQTPWHICRALILVFCFSLTACQKDDIDIDPQLSGELTEDLIRDILQGGGQFNDPVTRSDTNSTNFENEVDGVQFSCTRSEVDATIAPDKFFNFDPNADVIIAGNLLAGNSLQKATPDRVPLRRGPGKVSLSLFNASSSVSGSMDEYSPSSYFETVNDILQENSGIIPARFNLTIQEIKSEQELELAFQAQASSLGGLKASLSFSTDLDKKFNRFVVLLNQTYFSVLFDRPSSLSDFFHPDVTAEDLQRVVSRENPLTYVSSLNVGRQFALLIESTESSAVIEASANACFRGNCGGGSTKLISELENLRVKVFALGGEAGQLIQAVTTDVSELTNFLASSGDIRTGVPLSYVVRTVLEDKVVRNEVATKFTIENCVPITAPVCDCYHKGDSCDIPTAVDKFNERTVQKGSGGIDRSILTIGEDEVVVGMRATAHNAPGIKNSTVRLLHLIVKKINTDGSLGEKRVIKGDGNTSNNGEIEFEAPGNAIITGIGLRVSGNNFNRAQFFYREISLDESDCKFKFGPERETFIGSQGDLEQSYKLSDDYGDEVAVIKGLSLGVHDSNVNIMKVEVAELRLD
ncbi:MAG: thiol-activated cytolysin family protein [Bacteroidota bacterium]